MPLRSVSRAIIYLVTLAFIAGCSSVSVDLDPPITPDHNPATIRTIQYGFTVTNTTSSVLPKAGFLAYAPAETPAQHLLYLDCSHPYEIVRDTFNNRILSFEFSDIPPYAAKIVIIKARLALGGPPDQKLTGDRQRFLQPEPFVESAHPEIVGQAAKLAQDNPLSTVRAIFDFVSTSIQYNGFSAPRRGALYALRNKKGDCTEFTDIFVALLRASAIPARGLGGYVVRDNFRLNPAEFHNWAEFYVDGAWRMVDPQRKIFMENQQDYIAMRIIGDSAGNSMSEFNRFRVIGEGVRVVMKE